MRVSIDTAKLLADCGDDAAQTIVEWAEEAPELPIVACDGYLGVWTQSPDCMGNKSFHNTFFLE